MRSSDALAAALSILDLDIIDILSYHWANPGKTQPGWPYQLLQAVPVHLDLGQQGEYKRDAILFMIAHESSRCNREQMLHWIADKGPNTNILSHGASCWYQSWNSVEDMEHLSRRHHDIAISREGMLQNMNVIYCRLVSSALAAAAATLET